MRTFSAAGEYLTGWLDERRRAGDLEETTLVGYRTHIARMLPHFGDVPLDKLRPRHVSAFFAAIDAENEALEAARESVNPAVRASVRGKRVTGPATKQRIRATLRSALSDAQVRKLVTVNAASLVRLAPGKWPKARVWTPERVAEWRAAYDLAVEGMKYKARRFAVYRRVEMRPGPVMVWTPEQAAAFLDAVAGHRLYPLWHLIAYRGLRRGEACGLRRVDTDLDAGTISIQTELVEVGYQARESTQKSEASDALVALDEATTAVMRAWRKAQVAERLEWGEAWTDTGRVFTHEDGRQLQPGWVTITFQRLVFDAGLPPIREHDIRHGAASLARRGGADMKAIQAMLRHSSLAITADTYTSLFADEGHAVAEQVASVVPRAVAVGEASETPGPSSVPAGRPKVIRPIK